MAKELKWHAAGADTTSAAIAAFLFYVTSNEKCYQKLCHEVIGKFPSENLIRAGRDLDECVYLRASLEETLRMSPPEPGVFSRKTTKDCAIDGTFIPSGTEIGIGVYALHHNEDL